MAIACSFPNSSDSERGLKKGANALPSPSYLTSISGKSSAVFFPCNFQQDSAQFAFFRQIRLLDVIFRGCSSAGRALRSQCRGQEFDPPHLHQLLGGLAQLGERLHGMQEVSGSIPLSSTKNSGSPSSRGPGHDPFTVGTAVRIRLGTPIEKVSRWADFFCPKISRVRKRTRRGTACDGCGRCEFQQRN